MIKCKVSDGTKPNTPGNKSNETETLGSEKGHTSDLRSNGRPQKKVTRLSYIYKWNTRHHHVPTAPPRAHHSHTMYILWLRKQAPAERIRL